MKRNIDKALEKEVSSLFIILWLTILASLTCPLIEESNDEINSISVACNNNSHFAYAISYWRTNKNFVLLYDPQRRLISKVESILEFSYEKPLGKLFHKI